MFVLLNSFYKEGYDADYMVTGTAWTGEIILR